ncbi:hypothetical protein KSP39_PZI015875 [Platanthera zijinensis]|uniref:Uncharacterized protein n=1 Tax=Platanthera zijinensis TaxID=2320716 RepID=A0AAP0BAV6_9ASPA
MAASKLLRHCLEWWLKLSRTPPALRMTPPSIHYTCTTDLLLVRGMLGSGFSQFGAAIAPRYIRRIQEDQVAAFRREDFFYVKFVEYSKKILVEFIEIGMHTVAPKKGCTEYIWPAYVSRLSFSWQSFVETLAYRCCSTKRGIAGLSPSLCRPSKAYFYLYCRPACRCTEFIFL